MSSGTGFKSLAAIAFICGIAMGAWLPSHANADSYAYYIWDYPGTSSSTAVLTCGWHDVCTTGTDGVALDWQNAASASVYWRSYSSNTQGISWVGRVYVEDESSGSCHGTFAEVKTPLGTSLEGIRYDHTAPSIPGSPPTISSGSYPASTSFVLGSTVNNDCNQWPAHLHQEVGSSNWTKNSYYPTRAGCDDDYGCQSDNVWYEEHSTRTWTASGY